jgi:very-short-patch-repair endonuclease
MKIKFAKKLRADTTDAESVMWYQLRNRNFFGYKFRRQVPLGKYIADFVCMDKMLIVELDGGQHAEQSNYDAIRTLYLNDRGYKVIRFWNTDILTNLNGVLEYLRQELME